MKKTTIALAVAIASLSSVAYAAQPVNSFYAGGKLGWSSYHRTSLPDFDRSRNATGGGLFLGYQANPYLAFEVGYDYLGRDKLKAQGAGKGNDKFTVHGTSITGKLSYPLTFIRDNLDVYARGGAFINHNKFKGSGIDESYVTVSPLWGGGLEYQFTNNLAARIDYQWVDRIENAGSSGFHPNNSLLSLGLSYSFGGKNVSQKTVQISYNEKHYVLNEDVLFGYSDVFLSPDGKKALNGLLKSLKSIDPTKSRIIISGHTDRIGSESFNMKLSEARAKTVMNYLIKRGVPAKVISAKAEGKSKPVTGTMCNMMKGKELKTCLAPDRRVEIDVKAINITETIH